MPITVLRRMVLVTVLLAVAAVVASLAAVVAPAASARPAPSAAAPSLATTVGVIERPNVVYGSYRKRNGDRRKLRLDLWLPTGSEARRPVVVLAHGGAFRKGSRKSRRIVKLAEALAEHGYVTASISYRKRLARTGNRHRGMRLIRSHAARVAQHDFQGAVRFLRSRARKYRIDRNRIAALGSSAGGIAALRVAFNPEDPGHVGHRRRRSEVQAAVSLWGASDPRMIERGAPPIMMFHGRDDHTVPFKLARRTCRATRRLDNFCRHRWWRDERHSVWHRHDEIEKATLRFLRRHMGPR